MTYPLFQVDAFTAQPFAGNPAAVCVLPGPLDPAWMQRVAQEMNLSETAFLHRLSAEKDTAVFELRWFTPAVEVDLCGHATLASAHVLWESGRLRLGETARFQTKSGRLTADRHGDWIELDFPATPAEPAEPPPGLADALGIGTPRAVGRSRFDYLVEVDGEDVVRALEPDFTRLRALPVRGVIVTSRATTAGVDFVSRFFAPAAGVNEDPVTGSAHCALTPFWSARLGKTQMVARQLSARGGTLKVCLAGARVKLAGQAVTVVTGELDA